MTKHSTCRSWLSIAGLTIGLAGVSVVAHAESPKHAMSHNEAKSDDGSITNRVKQNLVMTGAEGRHIGVKTEHGVVTLSGSVKKASQRTDMVQSAKNTKGVKSVKDEIKVHPQK